MDILPLIPFISMASYYITSCLMDDDDDDDDDDEDNYVEVDERKSGFVISGHDSKGIPSLLASYKVGDYSHDVSDTQKCYGLTKGKIAEGMDSVDSGAAEVEEETGISVVKLLGEANYQRFKQGEALAPFDSPGYPGVRIVRANINQKVDDVYFSRNGNPRNLELFTIQVEHIEKLKPYLKKIPGAAADAERTDHVSQGVDRHVTENNYPSFDNFLNMLRTGVIQKRSNCEWALPDHDIPVIEGPSLSSLESEYNFTVSTPADLATLLAALSKEERRTMRDEITQIKDYFTQYHPRIIGDKSGVKLNDNKDFPLTYHFQGGEILSIPETVHRMLAAAANKPAYAGTMWGGTLDRVNNEPDHVWFEATQACLLAKALSFGTHIEIPDTNGKLAFGKVTNVKATAIDATLPASARLYEELFNKKAGIVR